MSTEPGPQVGVERILELKSADARYGQVPALTEVTIHVEKGEIVTLLGSNGAGKTTTLNAIYGLLPLVKGDVLFHSESVRGLTPDKLVDLGICYVPEGGQVFAPMSVMDNLVLGSYSLRGKGLKGEIEKNFTTVFSLFPVLKASGRRPAGTLSGGERQMLTLARALMSSPKVLLLDEPSLGLAPRLITEVMGRIAEMRDRGLSVLLVEQNARAALRIADRGYVMEGGRVIMDGDVDRLLSDGRVRSAYLGEKTT